MVSDIDKLCMLAAASTNRTLDDSSDDDEFFDCEPGHKVCDVSGLSEGLASAPGIIWVFGCRSSGIAGVGEGEHTCLLRQGAEEAQHGARNANGQWERCSAGQGTSRVCGSSAQ